MSGGGCGAMSSPLVTLRFAVLVSLFGSVAVSTPAVLLRDRQEANRLLERRARVLEVAGLVDPQERLPRAELLRRFDESVVPEIIELSTGLPATELDPGSFDPVRAARDPSTSRPAPLNDAGLVRLPRHALVYRVPGDGSSPAVVLPVEGAGLWSTIRGFVALEPDLRTIRGVTFPEHAETPGLGGEIDEPRWREGWEGRLAFGDDGRPRIQVVRGIAGPPGESPYDVDGLSGATITGRAVTELVTFWLGEDGYGPFLDRLRGERAP